MCLDSARARDAKMSESGEKSSEQEQELRRRNINIGAGEQNEEESSLIENIQESRKQSADTGDNNETMDSDHVRKNI